MCLGCDFADWGDVGDGGGKGWARGYFCIYALEFSVMRSDFEGGGKKKGDVAGRETSGLKKIS